MKGQCQGFLSELVFIDQNRGMTLDPGLFPAKGLPDPLPLPVFSLFILIFISHFALLLGEWRGMELHEWMWVILCSGEAGWATSGWCCALLPGCLQACTDLLRSTSFWVPTYMSKSHWAEGYQACTIEAERQANSKTTCRSVITVVPSNPSLPCRNETKFSFAGPLPPVAKDLDFTSVFALPQHSCWTSNITSAIIAALKPLKTSFRLWPESHLLAFFPPRKKKSENLLPVVG